MYLSSTQRISLVAVFSALSLGTNYAMISLPNIKIMDTLYFISAFFFGLSVGLPTVIVTRTVYASLNPFGTASPELIFVLIAGDCLYILSGAFARRTNLLGRAGRFDRSLSFGFLGLFSAFGFDLLTNFAEGLIAVTGPSLQVYLTRAFIWGLVTMNFPLPMGVFHEVSDFVFFSTIAPAAILLISKTAFVGHGQLRGWSKKRVESL